MQSCIVARAKTFWHVAIHLMVIAGFLGVFSIAVFASPQKWNYESHSVKVADSPVWDWDSADNAFDGYGTQGATYAWHTDLPTEQSPKFCEIDYGTPVAVSAFVNYCYVPDGRDMRYMHTGPSTFKHVRISAKDEKDQWIEVANLKDLPSDCPQVLPVNATKPARYWRIEVLELAPGAGKLLSYEIETYTDGIPNVVADVPYSVRFKTAFSQRVLEHKPADLKIASHLLLDKDSQNLKFAFDASGKSAEGGIQLFVQGAAVKLTSVDDTHWKSSLPDGEVNIVSRPTALGMMLELSYAAQPDKPIKYIPASLQITTPPANTFFIPAYAWSAEPIEKMVDSSHVQTRFAAQSVAQGTYCLVPGSDRGSVGFSTGHMQNNVLLGPNPTPILISFVPGDWWNAYKFVVREIYDFKEPSQIVPVSEVQYGTSQYLLSDEVWEPTVGTVKSWPDRDPHNIVVKYVSCFGMYGTPYSMPLYWARYKMNGEQLALERLQSIAHWLCRSGVRMQSGPARGAFFNEQIFLAGEERKLDKQGVTQARTPILTSHSTGSSLWSLLYYRKMTGVKDPEVDAAIQEAADWLMKTQGTDGGWPYGHDVEGKPIEAAQSAGCSWNIWALWRLGKETGEAKYLDAAQRGIAWYRETFVKPHHYHGYWEDVGPNSREGYDAAIATVAFSEMGEKDLAVETARDAIQWMFTRQIECRDASNSAGLVAEQTGWPPASYCNPMMGLAAHSAWQITGDDFWKPFAMSPKAVGWWYQPDTGAIVWMVDSIHMAPVVGRRHFESWWCDWCIAQPGSLMLRWLVREVNRRAEGQAAIDEESLGGTLLGKNVRAWAPRGGLHPTLPAHGQVNWLCFKGEKSLYVALMNHGDAGAANCQFTPGEVYGTDLQPQTVYRISAGKVETQKWDGIQPAQLGPEELILLEWSTRQ